MKMLRFSRLAVFVACIAAFASGCGGGGGGGTAEEMPPPVMECPQGQVGTYPDCTDPEPTDEQRIAAAIEEIANIVTQANTIEQAARSAVTAVEANADATVEQIASARAEGNAALDALRAIVRASGVANAATTAAAAEGAVANARAALSALRNAQTAAAGIQSTVEAVANLREQEAEEDRLATNGSSLIQHVRENKKVYDAVLESLGASSIVVNDIATATGNSAAYPYHTGTPSTVYPQPSDAERDVRSVTITVGGGGSALSSTSKTAALSGTARLPHGFDLKNADGTQFANAYTDITVATQVRQKTGTAPNEDVVVDNTPDDGIDQRYEYVADADYLLAGIWLNDSDGATAPLGAFAYGNQPIAASHNFCTAADVQDATNSNGDVTLTRSCGETSGLSTITTLVGANKDKSATYRGDANGAYLAGGAMSYFTADVELTAEFVHTAPSGGTPTGSGKISGAVTNIVAGGKSIAGSLDLKEQTLGDNISSAFDDGNVAGVIAGNAYIGNWKGRFFGMRYDKKSADTNTETDPDTRTTTYTPGLPDAVAGTFYATKQSAPAGDAAFIGSFATKR